MVEVTHRLQQAPTTNQAQRQAMGRAVMVLAKQRAIKEVKRELQAQGRRKVSQVLMREIVAMAEDYLTRHRELIAEAKKVVEQWHAEGMFGIRGGFCSTPRAKLSTSAQSAKA
jgi:hypothetical protein